MQVAKYTKDLQTFGERNETKKKATKYCCTYTEENGVRSFVDVIDFINFINLIYLISLVSVFGVRSVIDDIRGVKRFKKKNKIQKSPSNHRRWLFIIMLKSINET